MKDAFGNIEKVFLLGGTSDIGLAVISELASSKSLKEVVLAGRDASKMRLFYSELMQKYAEVEFDFCIIDLNQPAQIFDTIKAEFSKREFDLLLLSAGHLPKEDIAIEDPNKTLETAQVNFVGPLQVAVSALGFMQKQGFGTIVNVSSVAVVRPRPDVSLYGASKGALDYWIEAKGLVLRDSPIRLINVRPGMVRTKMSSHLKDAPLTVEVSHVSHAVVQSLHGNKSLIWVPKKMKLLALILSVLPKRLLTRLAR